MVPKTFVVVTNEHLQQTPLQDTLLIMGHNVHSLLRHLGILSTASLPSPHADGLAMASTSIS